MNECIRKKGVCRTASATPGLLNSEGPILLLLSLNWPTGSFSVLRMQDFYITYSVYYNAMDA